MNGNLTFTIIKPNAVEKNHSGEIINRIENAGFEIKALKKVKLTRCVAEKFYAVHKEKPFFDSLVSFMSSGPVIVAVLQKENAVESFRAFIGSTDPAKAAAGTIRKDFGESIEKNAVHGSDSDENAMIEGNFFFSACERV